MMTNERPIIWITGQPGAGKSTVGRALLQSLQEAGEDAFLVDGDDLRALTENADYSPAGREANIRRAQDIALYLSRQGRIASLRWWLLSVGCERSLRPGHLSKRCLYTPQRSADESIIIPKRMALLNPIIWTWTLQTFR